MECNKQEAIRARAIAQQKLQHDDFEGAKRFALKAQKLYPDLENIMQLLTVCNVRHCAKTKLGESEMDWYGILQIERSADKSSIKKQYRKLALLLHPDKNKFAGAEAAFKLIGEAHTVLEDQTKRSHYDTITAPKPKPTPNPANASNTSNTRGSADQERSQYDTKMAPKDTPQRSTPAGANNNQNGYSNFPFGSPHPSTPAGANKHQNGYSDFPFGSPHPSTPARANNHQNGYTNFPFGSPHPSTPAGANNHQNGYSNFPFGSPHPSTPAGANNHQNGYSNFPFGSPHPSTPAGANNHQNGYTNFTFGSPHPSTPAGANNNQNGYSNFPFGSPNFGFQYGVNNCSSFTFHYDNGCSKFTARYDVNTTPNSIPRPSNSPSQFVFTNTHQNSSWNFYQPAFHQTSIPFCSAFHKYCSVMNRRLLCPCCGSSIGGNSVPLGNVSGFRLQQSFAGPSSIPNAGSGMNFQFQQNFAGPSSIPNAGSGSHAGYGKTGDEMPHPNTTHPNGSETSKSGKKRGAEEVNSFDESCKLCGQRSCKLDGRCRVRF